MNSSGWKVALASEIGTSHLSGGTPCQDFSLAKVLEGPNKETLLYIVVADGAGSASRAERGAEIACTTVANAIELHWAGGGSVDAIDRILAARWIEQAREAIVEQAASEGLVPRDFACTLLFAVVGDNSSAFVQIGDGAIVVSGAPEDGWCWVHWPQRGEFANTTYFVTDEAALDLFAFDLSKGRIEEVAVFTDGIERLALHYASRSAHEPFFAGVFPPIRALDAGGIDAGMSSALGRYLSSPKVCERTDDDKTLVLATRRSKIEASAA
ncbi:MAG: PP2C family serine/threonine-protein phosphatase [Parvibaculum sp.]|uniref:PP2C family serine/threonine-protein phosphatase n=1 Tax=Parvibaculum sp. TaxID=2024848 RepID=UPI00284302E6|nr:PP2C family serine/threonine-protein phosphatase [Parvibaculum sp.]MDR3500686.1 PP2C family serine/threonine-protein phosphatase [Parvibaculum sp.]